MFSDPQKVKFDGTTETEVPRVETGSLKSGYLSSDGLKKLTISTTVGRRKRHMIRLDLSKVIASSLMPSQNEEVSTSAYLVVDRPLVGFTNEELKKLTEGLTTFLSATSFAATNKVLGSES
ncbi:TPA_asm: coat protein [ssRNA phage Zoerhiza.4_21]|uniref:Coat protein n=2 Tax=Leviviricetes TaxID=2842243 RepID=A0A8S5L1S6_9VIRU|nr:coat protein [ssRNA phage Zoerhiza.4_21]QDH90939.1 MAG: hypothetical protein H4Rhizo45315_000002 [Leviviridae sp.]DAD51435.1 TPA_asm: coat protein [ssRNA phage Zoerhiza.4_21]